jgi:hypothetical protein
MIMQRAQIGVSQRPQRSTVSVLGWRAQRSVPLSSLVGSVVFNELELR